MGVDPEALKMARHREHYEETGTVNGYVEDLAARWEYHQERERDFIGSEGAEFEIVEYVEAPPPVVWEFMTSASKRLMWEAGITGIDEHTRMAGVAKAPGTTVCMARRPSSRRSPTGGPSVNFTRKGWFPIIGWWKWTVEFRPEGEGTRFHIRSERLRGIPGPLRLGSPQVAVPPQGKGQCREAASGDRGRAGGADRPARRLCRVGLVALTRDARLRPSGHRRVVSAQP